MNVKDAVRGSGFLRRQIDTKKDWLDKVKKLWSRFKHGITRSAFKCAGVLFEGIDNTLESLAKFIPGLEALIEIRNI
jgi:hypothetical protein